jgi:hypothetical protein
MAETPGLNELKAELEGLAIFKGIGFLFKQALSAIFEKHKDTVTMHLGSIFLSMPYLVSALFEIAQAELVKDNLLPEHDRYQDRLCRMPRELSNAYMLQIVQGTIDSIKQEKDRPTLEAILATIKKTIAYHSALSDPKWNQKLHYMDLDKSIVQSDLPQKNKAIEDHIERLKERNRFMATRGIGIAALVAVLILILTVLFS